MPLVALPFNFAGTPWPPEVDQPPNFLSLAVAGNETVPGGVGRPSWNRKMSRAFLQAAVEGYADDGSDNEGEFGSKSRTLRLKVIEVVGGVFERVIGTVHTLN